MRSKQLLGIDSIISLSMPAILMAMTIIHNVNLLYIVLALGVIRINKPFVIFPVYFVASLSTGWFAIENGLSAGRFLSLLMIASLLIDLVLNGNLKRFYLNRKSNNSLNVLLLVFLVYCFMSSLTSLTGEFDAFFMMLQSLCILLLFNLRNNDDSEILYDLLFYTAIIVIIGVSIRTFSEGLSAFMSMRYGSDLAEGVNANRIAMMLAQVGAIFGINFLFNGLNPRGFISIVFLLLTSFIIILTGSRTGLIAIVIPFFILILLMSKGRGLKYIFILLFLFLMVFLAYGWLSSQEVAGLGRMSVEDVVDTGGADRMRAIKIIWNDIWPKYPLFGVGLGGANFVAAASQYGMSHPCHNIFFDSLCQLGLVGFVLFFIIVFTVFMDTFKNVKSAGNNNLLSCLGISLMLAGIMNGIGETVYIEKLFWNAITVSVIGNSFVQNMKLFLRNGKI